MKQKMTYLCGLAATLLLATACQNEDTPAGPETQTASATFHIQTRAGDGTHQTALYIAERKKENTQDELYCSDKKDIIGNTYTLTDMTAQWYKLAFISVPQGVDLPEIPADSAFNDLLLDYSPVLDQTQTSSQGENDDLAIYRVIKDRWLMPGEPLTEDAELTRITGQLVLDMGILNDQFAGQVTQIEVTLTDVPYRVYLRDNANGEIIYPEADEGTASQDEGDDTPQPEEPITYERKDFTYTFPIDQTQWESRNNFKMYFNLLPFTVTGSTDENKIVSGCRVTITRCEDNQTVPADGPVTETYPLIDGTSGSIGIQANTRTTLRFNGLEDNEFVVRYDKFGDNSNGIGVADDEWNGWNPPATGGDSSGNGNDQQP